MKLNISIQRQAAAQFFCVTCKTIAFSPKDLFLFILSSSYRENIPFTIGIWSRSFNESTLTISFVDYCFENVKLFHEKYIWHGTDNSNVWTGYKKNIQLLTHCLSTCADAKITRWKRKSDIWLFQFRIMSVDSNILCIILIPIIFPRSTL